jgi:transposase
MAVGYAKDSGGVGFGDLALTTKIGAAVDAASQMIVNVVLAPGQRHDSVIAVEMLGSTEGVTVIADRAFDVDAFRAELANRGCSTIIPSKKDRRNPVKLNREGYRWRHVIENVFSRLKDFVRVTLREDKTSASYLGFVLLAAAILNHRQKSRQCW